MLIPTDALLAAAERFGTPLYVYDQATVLQAAEQVERAFAGARRFYAMKANPHPFLLGLLAQRGWGMECVSLGELRRAQQVGLGGERVLLNGPAKQDSEYLAAAEAGAVIVLDRAEEVQWLPPASRVLIRVNPGLEVSTHPHLATGAAHSKFGVMLEEVPAVWAQARAQGQQVLGLHLHIGSAIQDPGDFQVAFQRLLSLRPALGPCAVVNLGGGWQVGADLEPIAQAARRVADAFEAELWVEPGRFVVAASGTLLTRVMGTKRTQRPFCLMDAGMTELLRPMLYGAVHPVRALWEREGSQVWDLAGPACESGDLLAREVLLPTPQRGDLLAVEQVGAYGASMSSHYLSRPRPAELWWDGADFKLLPPGEG